MNLREVVTSELDSFEPPAGDLDAVVKRGRSQRRNRTAAYAVAAASVVIAGTLIVTRPGGTATPHTEKVPHYTQLAAFDLSKGLRAFADPAPDGKINLGDKSFSAKGLDFLDTDAAATPYGVVFFDSDQKPRLLGEDGKILELGDGPETPVKRFHPSSKFDSANPFVAWTENHGDYVRIVLYDLEKKVEVGERDVPCQGKVCSAVKVDGLDQGMVFVRTVGGTFLWRPRDDSWTTFGGPKLRIADVRGKTLLFAGERPTMATDAWSYVQAAIDAQLTLDGKNILDWSPVLKPVVDGQPAITLNAPGAGDLAWFSIDTDGSILMAIDEAVEQPADAFRRTADVFDCEVPSGDCTKIGEINTSGGDPMFIGNDM